MKSLCELLKESSTLHRHLCPRQVLGVRMGMLAGEVFDLELPQAQDAKRLLTIVETDGCFSDGVAVATHCWVGRRTLRIEDYGKAAATFVDTQTRQAFRIAPRPEARQLAREFAMEARNRWEAMLLGYQRMPAADLFSTQAVQLKTPVAKLVSRASAKVICEVCGEEVLNEREIVHEGTPLCRACAGQAYYQLVLPAVSAPVSLPCSLETR